MLMIDVDLIVSSDKFQDASVPSHQEVDNINPFSFTDSVYAFEDVSNEARDNIFDPFSQSNRQDFKAKIDTAFNKHLPNTFKPGQPGHSDSRAAADLTSVTGALVQNTLGNTNSDEGTFVAVSDVAEGGDNGGEEQKVRDRVTTRHQTSSSASPGLSDIRDSTHSDQGQQPRPSHVTNGDASTMKNILDGEDSKKESRRVETVDIDSNKITTGIESRSPKNKQILWRSEDVSLFNDQDILEGNPEDVSLLNVQDILEGIPEDVSLLKDQNILEEKSDPVRIRKPKQQRLPKRFRGNSENENRELIFVDLPNLSNIDDFATVIEKNDTEGNVQRTVIIKNIPEAIQAFGIKNAPLRRKIFIGSKERENNSIPGIEMSVTTKDKLLGENESFGSKFDAEINESSKKLEENESEKKEIINKNIQRDFSEEKKIPGKSDNITNQVRTPNEAVENYKALKNQKELSEKETDLFHTFIHNDTNGNVQRTIVIKNTPEALRMFGIENVPLMLKKMKENSESDSIIYLDEEIEEVFNDIEDTTEYRVSTAAEENSLNDVDEASEFEIIDSDTNSNLDYDIYAQDELSSNAFNPLQKLRLNPSGGLQQDVKIKMSRLQQDVKTDTEENHTLKTLFYEDLSHETFNEKEEKEQNVDVGSVFEFTSPEFDLRIQTVDINDIMSDVNIDLFNLKQSEEREPKLFSEPEVTIGGENNLIQDSNTKFKVNTKKLSTSIPDFLKPNMQDDQNFPHQSQDEFLITSNEFDDTRRLLADNPGVSSSLDSDTRSHADHGDSFIGTQVSPLEQINLNILPEMKNVEKNPANSEGQTVTIIGSENYSFKSPELDIVIPSTLDHEQNNQFLTSSQLSFYISLNKSPDVTYSSNISESEEGHQIEISSNLHSSNNNILTNVPPVHDIVHNLNNGPNVIFDNPRTPDNLIVSKVHNNNNNPLQHSNNVRFLTDEARRDIFLNNDISSIGNQNTFRENNNDFNTNNNNNNLNQNIFVHNINHNNIISNNDNPFIEDQDTVDNGNLFEISTNKHDFVSSNSINKNSQSADSTPTRRPIVVTPIPISFQSASGRIRMPVTFQYGFEPMTQAPDFSPTPSPSTLRKPIPILQKSKQFEHSVRPRRTNIVDFYQQPSVLDRVSGLF